MPLDRYHLLYLSRGNFLSPPLHYNKVWGIVFVFEEDSRSKARKKLENDFVLFFALVKHSLGITWKAENVPNEHTAFKEEKRECL